MGSAAARRSTGTRSASCRNKLHETLPRKEHGLPPVPEQETVGSFLRRCLDVKQDQVRERARKRYRTGRAHPSVAETRAHPARQTRAAGCRNNVCAACRRRAPPTWLAGRDVLRTALNLALRWEQVSRNVAALTDAPRHRPRQIEPLTPAQASVLLAAVAGHRLEGLITVAVGPRLRQGEALGLRWEDPSTSHRPCSWPMFSRSRRVTSARGAWRPS